MNYYRLTLVGYDLICHMPSSCRVLHDMHPNVHAAAQAAYEAAAQEIIDIARNSIPIAMPYSFSLNFSKGECPSCMPACIMLVDSNGAVYTYSEYQVYEVADLHLGTEQENTEWVYRDFLIKRDNERQWYSAYSADGAIIDDLKLSAHYSLRAVLDIIDEMYAEALGQDGQCDLFGEVEE